VLLLARSCFALILLVLAVLSANAQQYTFARYGQEQGLNNLNVNAIVQDRAGFLWAGTESGLFRFNGKRFEEVPFGAEQSSSDYVSGLTQDAAGRMWVSTEFGVYVVESGQSRAVLADARLAHSGHRMFPLADPQGGIGVIADNRLLEVRPAKNGSGYATSPYPLPAGLAGRTIYLAQTSPHGGLWLSTDIGLVLIDAHTGAALRWVGRGQPSPWQSLLEDRQGTLWLGRRGEVASLAPSATKLQKVNTGLENGLGGQVYFQFAEDAFGRLLMLFGEGIARLENGRWHTFLAAQGIGGWPALAMVADRDGNIWIAQFGHGVAKWLGYGNWEHWTAAQGLGSAVVWGISREREGRLLFADEARLNILAPDGTVKSAAIIDQGRRGRGVAVSHDGSVWLSGGSMTVTRFDPSGGGRQQFQIPARAYNVFAASSGDVWIASVDGMWRAQQIDGRWQLHPETDSLVNHGRFYEIAELAHEETGDSTIFAVSDETLLFYRNGTWQRVDLSGTEAAGGLGGNLAVGRDGSLWLSGSFPGILHAKAVPLAGGGMKLVTLEEAKAPQLSSNRVVEIGVDGRGWVWVCTSNGLSVRTSDGWRWLTQDDGLLWNDTDRYGFYSDRDGSVWIGTSEGLSHLLNPAAELKPRPLPVLIDSLTSGERQIPLTGAEVRLAWSQSPLTFKFASLSLRDEQSTSFFYRLEGFEPEWVKTASGEQVYPRLGPGTYHFQVFAENASRGQRSAVASLTLKIVPPWWRSTWFYGLAILSAVGLLAAILLNRDRRQRNKHLRLEAMIAERTAELRRETAELKLARSELMIVATHDHLTRIYNRGAIMDALERETARATRENTHLLVILLDVDHFKRVNDNYGHRGGDLVLIEVASRLRNSIRSYDSVGRYGGEEFLIILSGMTPGTELARVEAMHAAICGKPYDLDGTSVQVTCSFGVADISPGSLLPEQAVAAADEALYRAKANGRNRIEYRKSENFVPRRG